ncbi:NUDIX hydrolase N-terminal domain-containing protein [Enterococcus gallinarum]|uniref:NUDIX hydrolase N-terminal domain-containing protein n=1 Tax=Enterococcus gallinarum TaxID=1353 RepID=UPI001D17203A|nr:NUDIX hydrolase [Enterococcus gallinarum]MCC4044318.1 NUDIX hydrolase [Enterococcus gallinarum]
MQEIFEKYQRLLAIADAGIYYGKDIYDQERYVEMKEILVELMSRSTEETTDTLKLVLDTNEGYPTPKVDVRALIRQDNKVLLVEDIHTKEWSLPGGYAEVGFSPKENVIKEVLEETGLVVEVDKLCAVFDTNLRKDIPQLFQYYKLVFACSIKEGSFVTNSETSASGFFTLEELPPLSMKRTTAEQLKILMEEEQNFVD